MSYLPRTHTKDDDGRGPGARRTPRRSEVGAVGLVCGLAAGTGDRATATPRDRGAHAARDTPLATHRSRDRL